jgi:uncharacterized phage-associated protein
MVENDMNLRLEEELRRLALLPEEGIDTSDMPEITDWSSARRGAFFEGRLEERGYDVRALANWFLDRLNHIGLSATNLSLNKLLYFAFERSLVERGVLLTPARIEAWDHGPVFREVYHAFKHDKDEQTIRTRIETYFVPRRKMSVAMTELDPRDGTFLEEVLKQYGSLSGSKLRELSHSSRGPWHAVWYKSGRTNPGMAISVRLILMRAPSRRQVDGRS